MEKAKFEWLVGLLEAGDLKKLEEELTPALEAGDLDARYLNAFFSTDQRQSGEDFDKENTKTLLELAKLRHPKSLRAVAWKYRHGDDLPKDMEKFIVYLVASALLGDDEAMSEVIQEIALQFVWEELDSKKQFFSELDE